MIALKSRRMILSEAFKRINAIQRDEHRTMHPMEKRVIVKNQFEREAKALMLSSFSEQTRTRHPELLGDLVKQLMRK